MRTNANRQQLIQNHEQQNIEQKRKHDENLNVQQIVKSLMESGNFFIKGDGNIDATIYNATGNDCNIDVKNEKLNSIGKSYRLSEMLEHGDFKQGVVLDLRCNHSQFILQQVKQLTIITNVIQGKNISYTIEILRNTSTPRTVR